jgi:type IV pilus assembly protein PilQ
VKKTLTTMPRSTPAGLGKRLALAALLAAMTPLPAAAGEPAVTNRLGQLAVRETDSATEIVVTGSGAPTFTVFKLSDPVRLFIDVSNADTTSIDGPVEIDNGVVGEVTALQFNDSQAQVGRIVVGLEVDALYKVQAQGNQLVVTVDASQRKRKAVPLAAAPAPDPAAAGRLAALESRAAEAERRAREAEARSQALATEARAAETRAAEVARTAEADRTSAARAQAELSVQAEEARRVAAAEKARAEQAATERAAAVDAAARASAAKADAESAAEKARQAKTAAETAAETARQAKMSAEAEAVQAKNDRASAFAEAEKAKAEKAAALAAAEKAKAEKMAAEAAAERALARAAADQATAERAAADRDAARAAAEGAARRAAELEAVASRSVAGSRDGDRARAEAAAARQAAERAAADKIAAERSASEALARARDAESRAQTAEADRRKLQAELGALDAQRQQSLARITALEAAQGDLTNRLDAARREKDETAARRLEAESVARTAELRAQRAEVARVESAQAASAMDTRLRTLEGELASARPVAADAAATQRALDELRQEAGRLESQLRGREAELQAAREEARKQRDAADALPGTAPKLLAAAPQQVRVGDVRFDDKADRTEIRVRVDGRARYAVRTDGERTRILEIEDAQIDPSLERSLDTGAFPSAVQLVSSFQAAGQADRVRVVATLRERVADRVRIEGDTLVWSFDKPARVPAVSEVTEVDYNRPRAAVYAGTAQQVIVADGTRGDEPDRKKKKKYTGRKINIDIKDADIHNVLRLLAKEGNINIVTSDTVTGTVTVHLKMVPWDQALDLVLRSKGLDMVQEGSIVRVAKAEDIKAERDREIAAQEQRQKLKPVNVKLIAVNHATAAELLTRIQSVLSDRGKAEFDARTNTVIVKDVDESLEAAEDLVRRLDTQTPQVLIEARIVEVNTNSEQQFGIQWGGDSVWSGATGNPTGLYFPSVVGIQGAADDGAAPTEGTASNPNFVVNMPTPIGAGAGGGVGFTLGSVDGTFNLNVRLSAAESSGQVKIVSSPKITTLDNNLATISQGVSIPISQVSAAGVNTVFFDAVLSLKVKPHVTQDGNIYLDLDAENNTPDFQNVGARGDPTILKKNAKTNVLLKDGDTTVIGGIYTSNGGYSQAEVPFFARIPILGVLFRNHRESDRRTELLIFITPRIVNRAAASVRTAP